MSVFSPIPFSETVVHLNEMKSQKTRREMPRIEPSWKASICLILQSKHLLSDSKMSSLSNVSCFSLWSDSRDEKDWKREEVSVTGCYIFGFSEMKNSSSNDNLREKFLLKKEKCAKSKESFCLTHNDGECKKNSRCENRTFLKSFTLFFKFKFSTSFQHLTRVIPTWGGHCST